MDDSRRWGIQRCLTLVIVSTLHLALIRALLTSAGAENPVSTSVPSVELLLLPTVSPPKVRFEFAPPRRFSGNRTTPMRSIALGTLSMSTPAASRAAGNGSGVDWAAEASRALHAYEIRNHRPPRDTLVSGESEDEWLRQLEHHPGDQVRTPSGDWIIWVSAECYQVARSGTSLYAAGATLPQTICIDRSGTSAE